VKEAVAARPLRAVASTTKEAFITCQGAGRRSDGRRS
jgi:hypothetical protein